MKWQQKNVTIDEDGVVEEKERVKPKSPMKSLNTMQRKQKTG